MKSTFPPVAESLILGCINKKRVSQKRLYDLLSPHVFGKIIHAGFCEQEAEELSVKVFIAIFSCIVQYNYTITFEEWYTEVHEKVAKQFHAENQETLNL